MNDDLETLRHMLGIGSHIKKRKWGFRNHFAPGEADLERMERLRRYGLVRRGQQYYDENWTYYHATYAGCIVAGLSVRKARLVGVAPEEEGVEG